MQFNSNSDNFDLVSEILKICKATTGKYPLKDITRRVNAGLDRYFSLAKQATGDASFDDSNQAAAPIGTQTITSGINAYKISSFTGTAVNIVKLEVVDSSSVSHVLVEEDLNKINLGTDYSTSVTGTPTSFVKLGDFLYIRPTPNFTKSLGLVGYIDRPALYFVSTDNTKEPGIPRYHHMFLAHFAAQPYLQENSLSNMQANAQDILNDEREILLYFNRIHKGNNKMRPKVESSR